MRFKIMLLLFCVSNVLTAQERSDGLKIGMFQRGEASYYAEQFHGLRTANGENFDMYDMTAAHKSLPFGTVLAVTNLRNNIKVEVRVNDRGPYIDGRIIDVSKKAAQALQMIGSGVAPVEIVILALPATRKNVASERKSSVHYANYEEMPTNRRYAIQVASYATQEDAQRQLAKFERAGIPIHLERFGKYYRLILVELNWAKVDQYRSELARLGISDVLVRQE